jgi:hypothetical protein
MGGARSPIREPRKDVLEPLTTGRPTRVQAATFARFGNRGLGADRSGPPNPNPRRIGGGAVQHRPTRPRAL